MKRLVLNGSPRGKNSNSRTIISWMFGSGPDGESIPVLDLSRTSDLVEQRRAFVDADQVLFVFPLYADSMPGIVKGFIDALADVPPGTLRGKSVAFVVHSGFPEGVHSEALAAYLARLSARMGWNNLGIAIKGGSEGFRLMPPSMTKKTVALFSRLGGDFLASRPFDPSVLETLSRPWKLTFLGRLIIGFGAVTGIGNMYWNMMLRRHGAAEKRFDRPYADALDGPWK